MYGQDILNGIPPKTSYSYIEIYDFCTIVMFFKSS